MNTLQHHTFKAERRRKKSAEKDHKPPVCVVIVSNTRTGVTIRKSFKSWDDARTYRDQRSVGGRMFRINIEPL